MSRILFLSHSHAFGPFRVGSHHYARTLAQLGDDMVHLSTPISAAHRLSGRASVAGIPRGPFRDADGVTHLVPRTLAPAPYVRADRLLARHGLPTSYDAVILDQPLIWHDAVRDLAPRLVYRPTDLYPDGVKHKLQTRILAAADGVIATSDAVRDALATDLPAIVIANGVDAARFAAPAQTRDAVCVYVGALDARFDWAQVAAWATARPDVRFVIAGPGAVPPLPANVETPGPVPYADLPALLHGARVGLLPLSDDPLNAGRSPMKLYEYLAAGVAVLTRETPGLRTDEAAGLYAYTDDAVASLDRALAHPSPNLAGVARALDESWDAKAEALRSFVLG